MSALIQDPYITDKIRAMCGYIKDDAFIANYLGISEAHVKRTRGRMTINLYAPGYVRKAVVGEQGLDALRAHEKACEIGSRALLNALIRYAQKHCPDKALAKLPVQEPVANAA
jgi:hypothetical protein